MTIFDAYVVVDWSARSVASLGADSIWYAAFVRENGTLKRIALRNVATRAEAREELAGLLANFAAKGKATLVGFDFPFGFPAGLARALGLRGKSWRAVWDHLASEITDGPKNRNNRFEVAKDLNKRISGEPFPFWGCPPKQTGPYLVARGRRPHGAGDLSERRVTDRWVRGPQPVWKLLGVGSVGSQALLGIPVVHALRRDPRLRRHARIWPLETGLVPLARTKGPRIVFAEVYPSMVPAKPKPGEVKDRAQVIALAKHFAGLDRRGMLAALFAGGSDLSPAERRAAETEESWILGAQTNPVPRFDYVRAPDEIYRRSFALVRKAADVRRFPRDAAPLVLRLIHACGTPEIARDLVLSKDVLQAGRRALKSGAPILVDCTMVAAGITRARLSARNKVLCTLGQPRVPGLARAHGTTRSAAAVDLWRPHLEGAVVAIGNAPTALYRLLELIRSGAGMPALIAAFPVGFVGAAESKEALIRHADGIPFITLRGRRGGSALAAAAVNALASPSEGAA